MNCFSTASKTFGWMISIQTSRVLHHVTPEALKLDPAIKINYVHNMNIKDFVFLAGGLSSFGTVDNYVYCSLHNLASLLDNSGQEFCISKASHGKSRLLFSGLLYCHHNCMVVKMFLLPSPHQKVGSILLAAYVSCLDFNGWIMF